MHPDGDVHQRADVVESGLGRRGAPKLSAAPAIGLVPLAVDQPVHFDHCIMPRSFSPTSSIGWAFILARHGLERGRLAGSPAPSHGRSGRSGLSSSTFFIAAFVSDVTIFGPEIYSPSPPVWRSSSSCWRCASLDQVDDQLHLVEAFEIGHLGCIAGLDQRFRSGLDRSTKPPQARLFTEEVCLVSSRNDVSMTPARVLPMAFE